MITAAPKRDYSTRITLEPEVDAGGEYLGVVLGWVGNRVYQHAAIVRSAAAENTFGLGALRSVALLLSDRSVTMSSVTSALLLFVVLPCIA